MAKSRARKLADIIVGAGIDIDGNLTFDGGSTSADLTFADNDKANFGDASDLQIYHNGSHSFIKDAGTGDLYIGASNNLALMNSAFSENYLLATTDGAVTLYYDGSSKLATFSGGVSVTGQLNATTMHLPDGSTGLQLGASNDTKFFHDGSNSKITHSGSGGFYIGADTLGLQTGAHNENYLTAAANGAVSLYYDNSAKFATTSAGIDVTGSIDVTSSASYGVTANRGFKSTADIPNFTLVESDASGQTWQINSTGAKLSFRDISRQLDRLVIDTAGRVGIGTTSPSTFANYTNVSIKGGSSGVNLDFHNASGARRAALVSSDAGLIVETNTTATPIMFKTGATPTERVRIDSSGNVGIGTASPSAEVPLTAYYSATSQFHIGGAQAGISNNVYYNGSAYTNRNTSVGGALLQIATDGSFAFRRATSGSSPTLNYSMYIDSLGKVGIGTTSPGKQLTINGADAEFLINRTGSYADTINMGMPSGVPTIVGGTDLAFGGTGTWTEHMRIKANGNVGIGTASPDNKLHVYKGDSGHSWSFDGGDGFILENSDSLSINITTPAANSGNILFSDANARGQGRISYTHNNDAMAFMTGGISSERVRITSTGNVGIGRTDPSYALDVQSSNGPTTARFSNNDGEDTLVRIIAGSYNTELDARLFLGEADTYGMTMEYDGVANIGYIGMNDNADPTGSYSKRIQMSRSGTEVAFMAGKVGIGVSSPGAGLHVSKAADGGNPTTHILQSGATNAPTLKIEQTGSGGNTNVTQGLLIEIAGTSNGTSNLIKAVGRNSNLNSGNDIDAFVVKNGGNVGIGTASPTDLLTVTGTIAQYNSYNDAAKFLGNKLVTDSGSTSYTHPYLDMRRWTGSAANHYVASIELAPTNADAGSIVFYSDTKSSNTKATTERMRIDSSGVVKVTSASWGELHLDGASGGDLILKDNGVNYGEVYAGNGHGMVLKAHSGQHMHFLTDGNATPRAVITNAGNVGIGTTSPGATLHTVAKAGTTGLLVAGAASNNVVYFANSSGVESFVVNADGKTKLRRSGSAGTVQVFEYGSGQVGGIQVQSTGLGVGGAARENDLFIKTDGKVGIGTTTPSQALHVVGQIYTSGTGGTGYFDGHRVILESTSSFANIGTDAYQISNVTTDGLVIGRNTSRLVTVKPNGNVGVGVDSPDRKLHVGGSIKVGDDNAYEDTGDNFNGGVVFQTPIYTEYQWKWNGADDHETNLYCGSYFMAEIVFTQHQTNGGTDINRHLLAKWANNHTHHELETIHDSGSTWSMTTSITATDHNLIATGGSGTAANGRLRIVETYGSGSYSFSTLTVRVYTGALSNVTHTYG